MSSESANLPSVRLGFIFAFITVLLWGILPIGLTLVLSTLEPSTVSWFQFSTSFIIWGVYLFRTGNFPSLREVRTINLWLLVLVVICLVAHDLLFINGVKGTSPTVSQVVMQISTPLASIAAIAIFRERCTTLQWSGMGVLVLGLILFFNQDIQELVDSIEQYFIGVIFLLLSASCWVVFIVLQKHLLMQVSASTLMLLLYGGTASLLTNFALPEKVFSLNPTQIAALIFCCLSTVISYASFAKSMEYWETSRSAAMLALVPITTAILVALAVAISPELIPPDPITPLGIIGIVLVLVGASATSLGSSSP